MTSMRSPLGAVGESNYCNYCYYVHAFTTTVTLTSKILSSSVLIEEKVALFCLKERLRDIIMTRIKIGRAHV